MCLTAIGKRIPWLLIPFLQAYYLQTLHDLPIDFRTSPDSTIVATLLVPISSSFSSLETLSWIGSAYLIGQSTSQPLSGRLTDIFGQRKGLLCCDVVFGIGTLLCGVATKEWVLIMGRAIAGVGGGAMLTRSMCVSGDLVPLQKRGVIQGIANIVIGAGSGLGGLPGGWVNSVWGWRMAFLIHIAFLLVGAVVVHLTVRVPVKDSKKSALQPMDLFWLAHSVDCMVSIVTRCQYRRQRPSMVTSFSVDIPTSGGAFPAHVRIRGREICQ